MKKTTKLISLVLSFCMVLALGVIGVLAVQSLDLQIGGSINFTAEGVNATIKLVEIAGLTGADGKFQDVTINTQKTGEQMSAEFTSAWGGLELGFDPAAETPGQGSIKFSIENTAQAADENILVTFGRTKGVETNATFDLPTAKFITPSADPVVFEIPFKVIDTEVSASIEDFDIVVNLEMMKTEDVMTKSEAESLEIYFYSTTYDIMTSIDDWELVTCDVPEGEVAVIAGTDKGSYSEFDIPPVINDNGVFKVVTILNGVEDFRFKVSLPNTIKIVPFGVAKGGLETIIIPSSVTHIDAEAIGGGTTYIDSYYVYRDFNNISLGETIKVKKAIAESTSNQYLVLGELGSDGYYTVTRKS